MIKLVRAAGTGKTQELLTEASKHDGIILTKDRAALEVKAKAYGFYHLNIIDYYDLINGNYKYDQDVYVVNADDFLEAFLLDYFKLQCKGITVRVEE